MHENLDDNILSHDATLEGALTNLKNNYPNITGNHLDIGSGTGNLIRRMRMQYNLTSSACDYTAEFMALDDVKVDIVDLNDGVLPYADNSFDLVTFTEVAEHLENYRAIVREVHRILKPGGVIVLTTPNILNMKSRMRFLTNGFWSMFGPLHVGETAIESTGGHITPIAYPYLAHALMNVGFDMPKLNVDKMQFPSIFWLVLFYLPIQIIGALVWRKERNRYHTLDTHNAPIISQINSLQMLLGRCIVVSARKTGG
ncbi:MAG: class I SAM-dependent methyltransferase [Mariprofundus sp.]|nr:class I SAM-dependent methyltransferase [Mariprofundus sp.]